MNNTETCETCRYYQPIVSDSFWGNCDLMVTVRTLGDAMVTDTPRIWSPDTDNAELVLPETFGCNQWGEERSSHNG